MHSIPKTAIPSLVLLALFCAPAGLFGSPPDLLKQAIEENEETPAAKGDVRALIGRADRLAEQRRFNEAIALYERAYRLAPTDQASYARLLVAKRAAGTMTAADREALALIEETQAAAVDQVFRSVRLYLIQGRQALRGGSLDLAASRVAAAEAALKGLPDYVEAAPYRRRVEALRRALNRRQSKDGAGAGAVSPDDGTIAVTTRVGASAGEGLALMDTGDESDTEAVETGEIIDVDEVLRARRERHAYDRELAEALARQRADVIISNNEAALPLTGMTFPEDWAARIGRRAGNESGVIFEGRPFTGEDGQTYQTVIYDLGDLVHPVPNFYADYPGTARRQRFETLDRVALRRRSEIFNGYADDLAAGLPLLHFFGGIDNNAVSTRTDPRARARIIATLEAFIHDHNK